MKRRKSEPVDAIAPTAEELVQAAADKIAPIAQAAADRLEAAAEKMGPYAQQVGGYATQVGETVGPYALLARQRAAQSAHDIIERWRPALTEAMEKVSPNIEAAKERINDDLLPKLIAALEAAAAAPVVQEASKRGQATLAAAKGELALPEPALPEPKKKRRWIRRVLIVATVGGVVVIVARRLLAGQDADWQAARPTAPYTPPKPPTPTPPESAASPVAPVAPVSNGQNAEAEPTSVAAEDSVELEPPEATPAEGAVPTEVEAPAEAASTDQADVASDATEPATDGEDEVEDGVAPDADRSRYSGEGVYVGSEPPEGFTIKANERSMKYHVPESAGYERTHTEVWFNSEEAAQEAGFIRAQR